MKIIGATFQNGSRKLSVHNTMYQFTAREGRIKLLIENKLIICALANLHYKISREKFEPEPGFLRSHNYKKVECIVIN